MRDVLVARYEYIERLLGQAEQHPVLHTRPTDPNHRPHIELRQLGTEFVRKVLIEKNAYHATRSSRAFVACLMNASACSRRTEGKSSRNSSTVHPPLRWSTRICTGTRVPTKTGVPPMISGSLCTTLPSGSAVGRISGMLHLLLRRGLPTDCLLPETPAQPGKNLFRRDGAGRISLVIGDTTRDLAALGVGERRGIGIRGDALPDVLDQADALVHAQPADLFGNVEGVHRLKSMCFPPRSNRGASDGSTHSFPEEPRKPRRGTALPRRPPGLGVKPVFCQRRGSAAVGDAGPAGRAAGSGPRRTSSSISPRKVSSPARL